MAEGTHRDGGTHGDEGLTETGTHREISWRNIETGTHRDGDT